MWNCQEVGNDLALKMLVVDGVCEPTLNQIQEDSENSANFDEKNSQWIPAWKFYADTHPGIPQHYLNVNNNDLQLANLPYSMVNREILYKVIVKLENMNQKRPLPSFQRLTNGTIIVTGHKLCDEIKHNIEIFLLIHDKLIPCCYTPHLENVIAEDPSTPGARVRCYYVALENAVIEVTFLTSRGKVTHRCEYNEMWFSGSTSYRDIINAVVN